MRAKAEWLSYSTVTDSTIEATKAILREDMELAEQREVLSPAPSWEEGSAER